MKQAALAILAGLAFGACVSSDPRGGAPAAGPERYDGALRIDPDPVGLEDTRVGCIRTTTLALRNTDAERKLTITGLSPPNDALRIATELPLALGPGASAPLDLHFVPLAPGNWSGSVAFATDEAGKLAYELPASARGLERATQPTDLASLQPLDLVFVLDVSTSMAGTARLREGAAALFDFVAKHRLDVRLGLVTFANDVVVHGRGAFLDRGALLAELDSQLVAGSGVPDPELPRQVANFDLQENLLDALYRAAADFAFRSDARRLLLLVTDDTFREPPAVFSDGTPVQWSYGEVAERLAAADIRLFAIHSSRKGRGLSARHEGRPSLVEATGGGWFELSDLDGGALPLEALFRDLVLGYPCD